MNRKIIVLLILIGIFAIVGVSAYAIANGGLEPQDEQSEKSEVANSEVANSEVNTDSNVKDENEGVDTSIDSEAISDSQIRDETSEAYDENGDLVSESKYLDEDGDTVANYFDICPGVDDFSDDCETDAYDTEPESTEEVIEQETEETVTDPSSDLDKNGDARSESKYLDEDGDTIANYYDICPGIDDFSDECAEL